MFIVKMIEDMIFVIIVLLLILALQGWGFLHG